MGNVGKVISRVISSKEEAGIWREAELPNEFKTTVQKLIFGYSNSNEASNIDKDELLTFKDYIASEVEEVLS